MDEAAGVNALGSARAVVRLEGGPHDVSGTVDLEELTGVLLSPEKIKIRHLGGYEHYEPVDGTTTECGDSADSSPPVFRWSGRTKIAE
ncbi:DUF5988 family protein [Streptomyces sp. NPDC089799]|uniref:DUF5988 family protein n=1 Tax=Streptomyces sp. NPDC089799 TaxID=3155066 RepID=UPI00342E9B0C